MAKRSNCPVNNALEIFGDKWTLLIVREMVFKDATSFSDFKKMAEKIATNILSDRLNRLQSTKIIEKLPYKIDRRKSIYRLTENGRYLIPVLLDIIIWSHRIDSNVSMPAEFIALIENDKAGVVRMLEQRLRNNYG
jgi:DNA-binding HxlR family transcriptional regulator